MLAGSQTVSTEREQQNALFSLKLEGHLLAWFILALVDIWDSGIIAFKIENLEQIVWIPGFRQPTRPPPSGRSPGERESWSVLSECLYIPTYWGVSYLVWTPPWSCQGSAGVNILTLEMSRALPSLLPSLELLLPEQVNTPLHSPRQSLLINYFHPGCPVVLLS